MAKRSNVPSRELIAWALAESYAGPAWHGPTVRDALRGMTAAQAARQVARGRNTIWDLVRHLTYGRHLILRRLNPKAPIEPFPYPLRRSWWPVLPTEKTERTWKTDLALLDAYQSLLLAAVAKATDADLRRRRARNRRTIAHELLGMALHDTYHAGQIRLLTKLRPK